MAYSPSIIAASNYIDIRQALGVDATDTTTVPDATIEALPYLPYVEGEAQATVTTYAAIIVAGGARATALKLGVIQGTAARLALMWMMGRQGAEVTGQGLGPANVRYREGPDWQALADRLLRDAAANLHRAEYWTEGLQSMSLFGRTGPTRVARTDSTQISMRTIIDRLTPEIVKGHEYTDHAHEELA